MKKWMAFVLLLALCIISISSFAEETISPCIRLAGNPTTGYTWNVAVINPDVLGVEETYQADEAPEGKLGVGGEYTFVLRGLSEGKAKVTFTYARSWENKQPAYTLKYWVQVDEEHNVIITASEF